MKIRNPGKRIGQAEILQLEKDLNVELPGEYKAFLTDNNGGYIEGFLCTPLFREIHPETLAAMEQSINPEMFYTLEEVREEYDDNLEDPRFSETLIPIGHDSSGNQILLGTEKGKDHGCVFFANHEWYCAETSFFVTTKIAGSFGEFVQSLRPYEE